MADERGDIPSISKLTDSKSLSTSLLAGATAGLIVDVTLFPLDTLKTRLQSQYGFWKSGGFSGVYKGLGAVAVGSAPCAAVFFATYNFIKDCTHPYISENWAPAAHMVCASVGEVTVCLIKVPLEIVKQRRQAVEGAGHPFKIIRDAMRQEGFKGLYRGFGSTVLRDVPFSAIQFPIWEGLKSYMRYSRQGEITPMEISFCGAISGGIAGAATTPLDVAKTRIMLADVGDGKSLKLTTVIGDIYRTSGFKGLFAGFTPRTIWIFLGGGIFFGVYEKTARTIDRIDKSEVKLELE